MKVDRLQMTLSVTSFGTALLVAIVCASLSLSATESSSESVEKRSRRIESNVFLRTPIATATTAILISSNEDNESMEPLSAHAAAAAAPPASAATVANRRGMSSPSSSRKSPASQRHLNSSSPSSMLLHRHHPPGPRPSPSRQNVIHGSDSAVVIARMTYLKKEMCKSEPLEQVIKEPGCIRRRIVNRFCYGQCNSFFIPRVAVQSERRRSNKDRSSSSSGGGGGGRRNRQGRGRQRRRLLKSEEDEEASIASASFRSCSYCRPKAIEWDVVILQCPNSKPPIRRKRIPVVKQCACVALSFDRS